MELTPWSQITNLKKYSTGLDFPSKGVVDLILPVKR
jgi:hypothetical protein